MALPDQLYLLCKAIREKGEKEATVILSDAREKAEQIVEGAREDANRQLTVILSREEASARMEARQIMDAAELKAQRMMMSAREELADEIYRSAKNRLLELRDSSNYEKILTNLSIRAVSAIPDKKVLLQLREQDQKIISRVILGEIKEASGKDIEILSIPAKITGGCLAYGTDRKVLIDFSFEALLKREEPRLRAILSNEVMGLQ